MTAKEAMRAALIEAKLAMEANEIPIGAVVLHSGLIIARTHNECEARRDATAHAEILAMQRASEVIGDWRLNECTLAVTLEPCAMCAGAMRNARLGRLIFGAYDPSCGAAQSKLNLLDGLLGIRVAQLGAVLAEDCQALLDEHFRRARESEGKSK